MIEKIQYALRCRLFQSFQVKNYKQRDALKMRPCLNLPSGLFGSFVTPGGAVVVSIPSVTVDKN